MFVGQFNDFMIWVLFAAVVLSALEGQAIEAVAIAAILLLNGVLGFVQEYQAERAMDALKEMAAPDGHGRPRRRRERDRRPPELVPGDLVLLESGDRVPADGRLVEVGGAAGRRGLAHRRERGRVQGHGAGGRRGRRRSATAPTWCSPARRSRSATGG